VARQLNYRPNTFARRLAKGSTESLGIVMNAIRPTTDYYGDILQGVEEEARRNGYNLYFSVVYPYLRALGTEEVPKGILDNSVDGLIYAGEMRPDLYERIKEASLPLVIVNSYVEGEDVECVMSDNFGGAYEAVRWLIGLGHRRIACIVCGRGEVPSVRERVEGYRQALSDAGISYEGEVLVDGYSPEDGYKATEELLKLQDPPTAIFGTVDEVAIGAIKCAKGAGLRVPEDLSVLGVNDLDIARLCEPPLTTVRIFRREMGRVAVRRLLELIREPSRKPARTDVPCELVHRESCAGPRD